MGVEYLDFWNKKTKEEQESARGHRDQQLHHIFLQVPSFMYVSFTSFDMHGIWKWLFGCDLSLVWRMTRIGSGFSSLTIS